MSDDKSDKPSKNPSRRKKPTKTPVIGANGQPVGRGNPPLYTQFKKGEASPNPKGRTKGSSKQNATDKILERKIPINIDGKRQRVTIEEAMTMAHIKKALAGDTRAFVAVMKARADIARVLGFQGPTPEETFKAKENERERQAKADELVKGFTELFTALETMKKSGLVETARAKWAITKPATRLSELRQRRRRGIELTPEELAAITAWETYEQHLDGKSAPH